MPLTVVIRRRSPRRRRWPIYAVLTLLAIGLSAPFWGVGFFRDDLIELVSYRIDRPVAIGKLKVQLWPKPALVIHDIQIGRPEFEVRAERVVMEINLVPLSRRVVDVTSIRIDELVWTIPERPGDLAREISALELQPGRGKGKWRVVVGRVFAEDARVVFAGEGKPVLLGRVDVRDLLENEITLAVDAAAPVAGDGALLEGTVSFIKVAGGEPALAIEGSATLTNVESRTFVSEDVVPNTQLDFASIAFVRTGSNSVTIDLNGNSYPASAEAAQVEALIGTFNATAVWEDGRTDIHIDEWRADGFEFTGDVAVDEDGAVTTVVTKASSNAAGIEAYFVLRPLGEYTVKPRADAKLRVADLRFHKTPEGVLSLQGGSASFAGVDLLVEDGAQAFTNFSGDVSFADNVVTLKKVTGDGLTIMGTVALDFAGESYGFDLNGEVALSRERLSGFVATDRITEALGLIQIAKLKGTATPGGGLPKDLVIEGKLVDGFFQIESPEWSDTLEDVVLTFDAETDRIGTVVTAQSAMFGAVTADGTYFTTEDRWAGEIAGDFSTVSLPSLEGKTREVVLSVLREFGRSTFDLAVAISGEETEQIKIHVSRRGVNPELTADVDFVRVDETWSLNDVEVTANLASRVLRPLLPESVVPAGPMGIQFNRSAANERFRADVDLAEANITFGDHLAKRTGAPFAIAIEGRADAEEWAADVVDTTILDTSLHGVFANDRFTIERFEVDVASLAPLLRDGGTASGRVTGAVHTNPIDVSLNFEKVHIAFNDDLIVDYINGELRVTDDGVVTDALQVKAANSDFMLSLRETDDRWGGGISGKQVDVNALTEFYDEYRSMMDLDTEMDLGISSESAESGQSLLASSDTTIDFSRPIQTTPGDETPSALEGEFNVSIDTLLFRGATLSDVRTRLVASGGNYTANDLSFVPNTGTAKGNVRYSRGEPPYGNHIIADLVFDEVDARIIDDLAFEEPRNLKGLLSGDVFLDLPMGPDGVELGGINGRINVKKGVDGTLGSLGIANAILFVFKTTEILFLRSPFAEGGLSYTSLTGKATIVDGVVTLGVFENDVYTEAITLERPSYRMSAIGWIDLGKWDSEIVVHMQPLSSVADAARIFKIDHIKEINSRGGIRIYMSGPPDDPKTKIGFGGPVSAITGEIRDGVQSVQDIVKEQIIDGIGGLLRGLLER